MLIDLLRHGEPVGGRKYRGQIDDPLSEKGWQQMWEAVGEHRPWNRIISSPLQRCYAFSEKLSSKHQLPLHEDHRIMEVGFGTWEGRTATEIDQADPGSIARFKHDPISNRPEGAEPLSDFKTRISSAWNELLQQYPDEHLLVVCHAGVMRMIISLVLNVPLESMYRIQIANAAMTRIQVDRTHDQLLAKLIFQQNIPG